MVIRSMCEFTCGFKILLMCADRSIIQSMFEFTCRFEIWSMSPDHIFILADHPIPPGSKAPPVSSGTGPFCRPTVSAECNGAPSPGCVFDTHRQLSAECTRAPSTRRIPTVSAGCNCAHEGLLNKIAPATDQSILTGWLVEFTDTSKLSKSTGQLSSSAGWLVEPMDKLSQSACSASQPQKHIGAELRIAKNLMCKHKYVDG